MNESGRGKINWSTYGASKKPFNKDGSRRKDYTYGSQARMKMNSAETAKEQARRDRVKKSKPTGQFKAALTAAVLQKMNSSRSEKEGIDLPSQDRKHKNLYRNYTVHTRVSTGKKSIFGNPKYKNDTIRVIHHRDATTKDIHDKIRYHVEKHYPDHEIRKIKAGSKVDMSADSSEFKNVHLAYIHPDDHATMQHVDHLVKTQGGHDLDPNHSLKKEISKSYQEWKSNQK